MASDIPPSVYLNAAKAKITGGFHTLTPKGVEEFALRDVHDRGFRAAVESVWEERGGHDADAIRPLHAEPHECPEWDASHGWVTGFFAAGECPTVAALDAQRPAEGGPEPVHGYVSTACYHGLHDRCRKVCKFCSAACRCAHHAPAALDSGQPATGYATEIKFTDEHGIQRDGDVAWCNCGWRHPATGEERTDADRP